MTGRERTEARERRSLSSRACLADSSQGRRRQEEPCALRTCFQRDVDRIVYSKAFRRLKHKTQVFLEPEGDHYRTRMTHTLEVTRIARTIARALNLNEDLTEAIGLGHDLGHTPFGHAGERVLNEIMPEGFQHNVQSLRVVDVLELEGYQVQVLEFIDMEHTPKNILIRAVKQNTPLPFEKKEKLLDSLQTCMGIWNVNPLFYRLRLGGEDEKDTD